MVRAAALILAIVPVAAWGQDTDHMPLREWVETAPYGVENADGRAWLNVDDQSGIDSYSMLLDDLLFISDPKPKVWFRGWHKRNKRTAWRSSKQRIEFDCKANTITVLATIGYAPDGSSIYSDMSRRSPEIVIPGTNGDAWSRIICSGAPVAE